MLIVPRSYHIHRRSAAKTVAASGHGKVEKLYRNLFPPEFGPGPRWASLQRSPISPRWWRGCSQALSKNPPLLGLSSLSAPFAIPWKKILRAPMATVCCIKFECVNTGPCSVRVQRCGVREGRLERNSSAQRQRQGEGSDESWTLRTRLQVRVSLDRYVRVCVAVTANA